MPGKIMDNRGDYSDGLILRYGKLEITFADTTTAENLQLPFDPAPPPGVAPAQGVSAEVFCTSDNRQTTYYQPAFYVQT